jgi:hypothetical protein
MKIRALTLPLLFCWPVLAVTEMPNEVTNKKVVARIKDAQVEDLLKKTNEFDACRKKYKIDDKDTSKKTGALNDAVTCFRNELKKTNKSEEQLKKLADDLKLEHYGLIPSKNVKDITNYLSNKMYQAMTGVDPEEKDMAKKIEDLKFKNRKMIDQKVFIDLYMTQLGKSAMFEISRFCFENFRLKNSTADNFHSHWNQSSAFTNAPAISLSQLSDQGQPEFSLNLVDPKDTKAAFDGIIKSIAGTTSQVDGKEMENFFNFCSSQIRHLCGQYQDSVKNNSSDNNGAQACLTSARLQEIRKAMTDSEKVAKQFNEMSGSSAAIILAEPVKFYDRGLSNEENSIDNLTNVSSADLLKGGVNGNGEDFDKLSKQCKGNLSAECEKYLNSDADTFRKIHHQNELEMNLKKEVELARINKFSDESLKEYLKESGYLELLARVENNNCNKDCVEKEVEKIFTAKIKAITDTLEDKVGKRQLSDDDLKDKSKVETNVQDSIQEAKEERARLAQVVMFNNIITSNLPLYEKKGDKEVEVGRNVNAWKVEERGLNKENIKSDLFQNLQNTAKTSSSAKQNSVVGLGMLDNILGAPKKKTP